MPGPVHEAPSGIVLSPNARLVGGAFVLAAGIALAVRSALAGGEFRPGIGAAAAMVIAAAVALPLFRSGVSAKRRLAAEAAELARGMAELAELRPLVAAAVAAGKHVGRLLEQRGYTSAKVRRKLALECGVILQQGAGH
jgi:hypothetical protein